MKPKIVFLGCTKYSQSMLNFLLSQSSVEVKAIFSIPEFFKISYSSELVRNYNFADLSDDAKKFNIPFYLVDHAAGNDLKSFENEIKDFAPDIVLVLGWYYMVPKIIREIPQLGAWGIHSSLLPSYAGGAPLVWPVINGEKKSGVTLFKMDSGVDDGDIIAQEEFEIDKLDTIDKLIEKSTQASFKILKKVMEDFPRIEFKEQSKSAIQVWPQRSPGDGRIEMKWDSKKIIDFVRAQVSPYPGAFIEDDERRMFIEKVRLERK